MVILIKRRWGIAGETLNKLVGRISKTSEAISGIPGSTVDHQGVPYSLTEEFVSVYRMHSLIPGKSTEIDASTHVLILAQTTSLSLECPAENISQQYQWLT